MTELRKTGTLWKLIAYELGYPHGEEQLMRSYRVYSQYHGLTMYVNSERPWTREKWDAIKADREAGLTWEEIARKLNRSYHNMQGMFCRYAKKHGLEVPKFSYRRKRPSGKRSLPEWKVARHQRMKEALANGGEWSDIMDRFGFTSTKQARQSFRYYEKRLELLKNAQEHNIPESSNE